MTGRYELSDQRWQMIEDIVSPPQTMGRPRRDDRQMLNGILWILCSGAQWRDDGAFDEMLTRLHLRLREDGNMDLDTWMVDSTSIRATRSASGAGKKGIDRTRGSCARP